MIYYNEGQFNYKNTFFKIPNRMGLELDPESLNPNRMELVAPDESFMIAILFEEKTKPADEYLQEVFDGFEESELEVPEPIHRIQTVNGLTGYHTKYSAAFRNYVHCYDEYTFELPENEMLSIYLKTFSRLQDLTEYERVKKELLDSLKIK